MVPTMDRLSSPHVGHDTKFWMGRESASAPLAVLDKQQTKSPQNKTPLPMAHQNKTSCEQIWGQNILVGFMSQEHHICLQDTLYTLIDTKALESTEKVYYRSFPG